MQVKKFEAKNMKDALAMIKTQLGPEAIILSVRDNTRGFGLMGEKSVEVTAAVSEETLRRKLLAEKKLNTSSKNIYSQSPARVQKAFIERANPVPNAEFAAAVEASPEPKAPERRPLTSERYVDIDDGVKAVSTSPLDAKERIRVAAQKAFEASAATFSEVKVAPPVAGSEVLALRKEIMRLKGVIEGFQKVPQSFTSLHPGADYGIPFDLSFIYEKLTKAGVSTENTTEILKKAEGALPLTVLKKPALVDSWVVKFFLDHLQISDNRLLGRTHVFVGPTGQGKTSALLKFASHLVITEKKRIAILTLDSMKLGASEQLKIYAQILNVPFSVVRRASDWQALYERLKSVDFILVDCPGFNLKNTQEEVFLRELLPTAKQDTRTVHYVQSVLAKDQESLEIAGRYESLGFQDVIFTSLDESSQHGVIYNFQKKFAVPLHSFSIGPQIPEDFEPATKERVVDLIFKISNIKTSRGNL